MGAQAAVMAPLTAAIGAPKAVEIVPSPVGGARTAFEGGQTAVCAPSQGVIAPLLVAELLEVLFAQAELVSDLVEERDHDFFVDGVIDILGGLALGRVPAAGLADDAVAEEVDAAGEWGVLDGALGEGGAGVQAAELLALFFGVGARGRDALGLELLDELARGLVLDNDGHLVEQAADMRGELLDGLLD